MQDDSDIMTAGQWLPLTCCGPFSQTAGPISMIEMENDAEEPLRIGMRILERHCNPGRNCHGGMLASLLDIALGRTAALSSGANGRTLTMNLSLDFMRPAPLGAWVESRTRVTHNSGRTAFVTGELVTLSGPLVRGSAIFRIVPVQASGADRQA